MAQYLFRAGVIVAAAVSCGFAGAQSVPVRKQQALTEASRELRKLDDTLLALAPQRPNMVDAYVVVVSLDGDPVFGREAREAARVLARRFDAAGRTLVLGEPEGAERTDAAGAPATLARALTGVAALMDREEDVLVLYSTSHGVPGAGLIYKAGGAEAGAIGPYPLAAMLNGLNVSNRLIILQACYSGQFIPLLANESSVVITAAADDRSSFGCEPGNDWTVFGHAFINTALRRPAPLARQFDDAKAAIADWEARAGLKPSRPQIAIGRATQSWLAALEVRAPRTATMPVGSSPLSAGN